VITCDTATTTASGTGTLATRVRTLTDIIGMNIHIGSRAAGYTNDTTLLADLAYMGVYNVRDHLELNGRGSADTFALLATLGNNGIKLLLSAPPDADGGNLVVADTVTAAAAMINAIPAGMLIAIEGPNEPDNFQYSYNGVNQTINGAAQQLPGFFRLRNIRLRFTLPSELTLPQHISRSSGSPIRGSRPTTLGCSSSPSRPVTTTTR
jgi:hypothetical protein